jgi:hypothetical protein
MMRQAGRFCPFVRHLRAPANDPGHLQHVLKQVGWPVFGILRQCSPRWQGSQVKQRALAWAGHDRFYHEYPDKPCR